VGFNREVLGDHADYFDGPAAVAQRLSDAEADPAQARERGEALQRDIQRYNWDDVAERYEALCLRLAHRDHPRKRPSGRRSGQWEMQPTARVAEPVRR
jgi:glycosyltransferase involved in cell wall biosynthesis